jgi:hypothetical protein
MESTAVIFTTAANARSTVVIPVASAATALPTRFPWRAATRSVPTSALPRLGEEHAGHSDQAPEQPRPMPPAGLDDWLDDSASGCG